jgi:hypothetical protein
VHGTGGKSKARPRAVNDSPLRFKDSGKHGADDGIVLDKEQAQAGQERMGHGSLRLRPTVARDR